MALWFPLMVNKEKVGHFYAQRLEEIPADRICIYEVRITDADGKRTAVIRHDYDAGAWELVQKALAELDRIRGIEAEL